ncbi:hypothetical protein DPMN_104408 [Dreissena polymorpha]|uniref:Uncharacterized protein n=1 Tax=Dreissena polymorpha TaxID=45954 RepID=A0A9D4HD15_DREPO|nr:hypothetical protein DPMN_104408 [Dreissena polymorpha]
MARQSPTRIPTPHVCPRGAPGLVIGPCIIEIDQVQYQLEVNRCRKEEIIVKGNFGWVWSMWAGRPWIGYGAMHINRCRNEEVNFQGSSANSVGGDSGQDGRTTGQTAEITTISPRFSKSVGIIILCAIAEYIIELDISHISCGGCTHLH